MEATVEELQNRVSAMQAALEGNAQSGLFKQPPFSGFQNEDVNEWVVKFNRLARFYGWGNAKKLSALPLLLNGPALAWFQTLSDETAGTFDSLIEALIARFGNQNIQFLIRQELYARKQLEHEPLVTYTEDIIKKCQRLNLNELEMMNIFINGLSAELKNHVVLNQPKTFTEAENLARLRDAVSKSFGPTVPQTISQDQRIKELEGQVNILLALASNKRTGQLNALDQIDYGNNLGGGTYGNHVANQSSFQSDLLNLKTELIAAIDQRFVSGKPQPMNRLQQGVRESYARGRNLRTTNGQPICNNCYRVGHVARYCRSNNSGVSGRENAVQNNSRFRSTQNFQQDRFGTNYLNEQGPSRWGN